MPTFVAVVLCFDEVWMELKQMLLFLFISVNGETAMATTINVNESTASCDCDGDGINKCNGLATDENCSDSDTQPSFAAFTTAVINSNVDCASTGMR